MKYTKEDLYVGFTFGPVGCCFEITAIREENLDFIAQRIAITYNKYEYVHLWTLFENPGWDYYIQKQPIYEIY